jgi:hypothetical protein
VVETENRTRECDRPTIKSAVATFNQVMLYACNIYMGFAPTANSMSCQLACLQVATAAAASTVLLGS